MSHTLLTRKPAVLILHIHVPSQIFTWTSLTTSWSSASAIALILGLAVKLVKSRRQTKIFLLKKGVEWDFLKVLSYNISSLFNNISGCWFCHCLCLQLCHSKISLKGRLRAMIKWRLTCGKSRAELVIKYCISVQILN